MGGIPLNEDATEVSTDDNADVNEESDDEGIESDEDNYDSAGDDTELSEFENDFGGVTQEDNTGLEGEDFETDKGKNSEIKAKVKTTKAKASERNEDESEAWSDDYYYESEDPPSHESEEEEVVTQTTTPPRKKLKLPSYNPESDFPELEKGMLFEDAKQFKTAMIKYAVHFKRDIYFYKNESRRVRVKCVDGCPFLCHCSWEERYRCFQLKTCLLEHRCNYKYKLKLVTQKWLEEKYEDVIVKDPTVQHTKLRDQIQTELKINVTVSMVRRAQRAVLEKVNLGYSEQFKRIRDYAQECLDSNPGSTVILETSRVVPTAPCTFQRLYVCFNAMKRGFLAGCRPIIGLDGCFLKGAMKGELLSAVGRDANNQMYPIAWAVVEIESTYSWKWFLQLLTKDLELNNSWNWTIISDQQKNTETVRDIYMQTGARNIEERC